MLNQSFLPFTIIMLMVIFTFARGCGSDDVNYQNVGVGMPQQTMAYLNGEKLDLSSELDPAQVPELVKESYLQAANLKKEGKELISFVIQDISKKVAAISSIDLNNDKTPDPILIVPEGNDEQMTFSIRIPDPEKVKTYPDDPNKWQDIAENQSIEVLSVTVYPRSEGDKLAKMDVEARPNQQVYENHHHHHYHSSFMHGYFTHYMISSLFFNPYGGWYGPGFYARSGYWGSGYYGNNYSNRTVNDTRTFRKSYNKSPSNTTAMKTGSGKTVNSSLSKQKSSSVSSFKSTAIKKRQTSLASKKATGFGSSKSKSSSSSWGRSPSRSSWGGGGSRGGK